MNILFICNLGRNRSRTAADLLKDKFKTRFKGVFENIVAKEDIDWADSIITMEPMQSLILERMFPKLTKQIICWNIPDIYRYNNPELIQIINEKSKEL
jgi:predicted protein tyrosine phosphatase